MRANLGEDLKEFLGLRGSLSLSLDGFLGAVLGRLCGRREWRGCLLLGGRESLGFGTLLLLPLLLCDMLGLGMYPPKLGRVAGCWCSGLRVKISALAVRRSAIVGGMLR